MPVSREDSPGEDYFNDLSQQPSRRDDDDEERRGSQDDGVNGQIPKPKRIACVLCRKRKLKCDGNKPSCGTCVRLQHDCSYDEVRRKSGPKRGYVKALEARLAQVETLLKTQDDAPTKKNNAGQAVDGASLNSMVPEFQDIQIGSHNVNVLSHMEHTLNQSDGIPQSQFPHTMLGNTGGDPGVAGEEPFPWEMIGLGLDEPLPTQDVVNELNQTYFDKIHPSLPMIHRPRYYAAMNLAPHMRPPVCLRYAMWANAASVSDKYEALQEHFYLRARKYIQQDEMKGHGESMITIAHCQTWGLIGTYEFKLMYFPRAWMSAGRASRLAQMMGIHRLDGSGLDVKQCLPPPRDWTEREERRRTFWMCFSIDRYSSIGTGWPMTIEEKDILTNLPSNEESYELSKPGNGKGMTLTDALERNGTPSLSGYGGVVLMACLFGRNLTHLHRPGNDENDDDLNGEFWKRHRGMDNVLLNTALALPDVLRLPLGLNDPNIIFLNMCIHTSTICLHQAAIFKADKNRMPARISAESKVRCITAAAEIASIMRQISHLDLSAMNPFISFCLYVAARVFVQYLKSRPKDTQVRASLQFLLSAMQALKRKNPLTESFLVQLDVDLEGAGLEDSRSLRAQPPLNKPATANRAPACPTEHLGISGAPTYGDIGLAVYNNPTTNIPIASTASEQQPAFGYEDHLANMTVGSNGGFISNATNFDLPNRAARSPGSNQSSGIHRSPQSFNPDMDTSPDGSGSGGGHQTPNSSTQQNMSTHTSHTGYSPQNIQQSSDTPPSGRMPNEHGRLGAGIFAHNDTSYSTDFDMHSFPASAADQQQQGFVLPTDWGAASGLTPGMSGSTGFTPGPTGFTPGANMGDMMGMTDADWNQMMDNMNFNNEWDSGLNHPETVQGWVGKK